jgi:hypothetical protein
MVLDRMFCFEGLLPLGSLGHSGMKGMKEDTKEIISG